MKQALPRKPVSRRAQALLRWGSHGFLLAGVLALGCSGVVWTNARLYQAYQSWRFDQIVKREPASVTGFLLRWIPLSDCGLKRQQTRIDPKSAYRIPNSTIESGASHSLSRRPGSTVSTGSLIGRIRIPRLGLSAIVVEGVDEATLRVAVGHIPGTALPGQQGNVGIAGHRDTFFRGLRKIRKDDSIILITLAGSCQYQVESIKVVEPNDTEVLEASDQPSLTLVTCYPFFYVGSAPYRFIVRARYDPVAYQLKNELNAFRDAAHDLKICSKKQQDPREVEPPAVSELSGAWSPHR